MEQAQLRRFYLIVLVLHLGLLWWLPFFPSQDGPSHVYNAVISHDLMAGGTVYGQFFDFTLFFTPNLGAAVPLHLLTGFLPPVVAEKVFLSFVLALLVGVVPRLARLTGGAPFSASFVVFPLLFSRLTLPGMYSFLIGIPLWLWAMWLFWRMRQLPLWQRSLASNASALVLFACHLLPFGCYVLACACATVCRREPVQLRTWLREATALLAPPALVLGAYGLLLVQSAQHVGTGLNTQVEPIGALAGLNLRQNVLVVLNLLTFEQVALSPRQFVSGVMLGFLVLWALYQSGILLSWRSSVEALERQPEERVARRWLVLTAGGLFAGMICVPDRVGELSLIKMRFPPLILLLTIPLLSSVTVPTPLRRLMVGVALMAAVLNVVLLSIASHQVEAFVTSLPLDTVYGRLVAGYRGSPARAPIDPLAHATSYYCAQHRCVDVDNYQAHSRQFFVRFKSNPSLLVYRQLEAAPTTVEWAQYPDIEYLLGWDFGTSERTRIEPVFTLLSEAGPVTLWHRRTEDAKP